MLMRGLGRVLPVVILAGAACGGGGGSYTLGGHGGGGGAGGAGNRVTGSLPQSINRNVDILFMIDDSTGMSLAQANLLENFPTFLATLQSAPQGLPNLHVAVVSQDMGAGDGSISGCDANGGKKGIFQYTARGTCTATNLQAGATFISNVAGQANYTGNLADVFTCIAALGDAGCGFEHQFAAILRALGADNSPAPAENAGFLRPEAYLAIVMLSDEDDCSASPGVPLYDTSQNMNIRSQLGPPTNFRCNEWGHLCSMGGGALMHPNRNAPNNDVTQTVFYDQCSSNDNEGYLLSVHDTANRIKALKTDPSMVFFSAILGPASPYQVHWKNPSSPDTSCGAASCPWPEIGHSCVNSGTMLFADPGVREQQLAGEFGKNGLVLSICDTSFAPVLDRIAQQINSLLAPPCISAVISLDPRTGGPDCQIVEHDGSASKTLAACADNGGAPPCWQLVRAAGCNGYGLDISLDPNASPSAAATVSYSCATCTPGMPDPARGCP